METSKHTDKGNGNGKGPTTNPAATPTSTDVASLFEVMKEAMPDMSESAVLGRLANRFDAAGLGLAPTTEPGKAFESAILKYGAKQRTLKSIRTSVRTAVRRAEDSAADLGAEVPEDTLRSIANTVEHKAHVTNAGRKVVTSAARFGFRKLLESEKPAS